MLEQDNNGHYRSGAWGTGKDYGTNKDSAAMGYFADKFINDKKSNKGKSSGGSFLGNLILIGILIFSIKWLMEEHPVILFILLSVIVILIGNTISNKLKNGIVQKVIPLVENERFAEAKDLLEKLANKYKDSTACDVLGNMYSSGNGVEQDLEKAEYYYKTALKFGDESYAPYQLAQILTSDIDNISDECIDYLVTASKNLNANATSDLVTIYITKDDEKFSSDYKRLYKQLLRHAQNGDAVCQFSAGIANATGIITEKNPEKAVEWYRKSAEQGYSQAMEGLSQCYKEGFGVNQNLEESEKWHKMSVEAES